jgi:hypothetical protein
VVASVETGSLVGHHLGASNCLFRELSSEDPQDYRKHMMMSVETFDELLRLVESYTGCNRRKGQNFGRVFLRLKYTDITQNTYIQS